MSENFYCEYCGQKFRTVAELTSNVCSRHPAGSGKGKHNLYEGGEKSEYTCKYCGQKFRTLADLTFNRCLRHPDGADKRHSPAL